MSPPLQKKKRSEVEVEIQVCGQTAFASVSSMTRSVELDARGRAGADVIFRYPGQAVPSSLSRRTGKVVQYVCGYE